MIQRRISNIARFATLAASAIILSACAVEQADSGTGIAQSLTDRDDQRVIHSIQRVNGDWETHVYLLDGSTELDVVVHAENGLRVAAMQGFSAGKPLPSAKENLAATMTFEHAHAIVRDSAKLRTQLGHGESFFDNYGCDAVLDSCAAHGKCCDVHDACYAANNCTWWSWINPFGIGGACDQCNGAAVACKIGPDVGPSECCSYPSTDARACGKPRPTTTTSTTSGGGGCFVPGTLVTMADGTTKRIEDIVVGDSVLSFDPDTQKTVASRVIETFVHQTTTDNLVVVNAQLTATANHPFYANGKWVRADALVPGDELRTLDASGQALKARVGSVEGRPLPTTPVYNLEVEGTHDYFAGGVLVHNKALAPDDGSTTDPVPMPAEGGGGGGGGSYTGSSGPTGYIIVGDLSGANCPDDVCP